MYWTMARQEDVDERLYRARYTAEEAITPSELRAAARELRLARAAMWRLDAALFRQRERRGITHPAE